ncbi:DUF3164 family protein [Massilia sp. NR 4-1]|uniref:DUF3164 family protein n=1 Tax=Massilia sp. NR 4-1 TaxID=1678028 RepID=UPI00067BF8AC|nr:DUF3164 family protein [Massilia sp. NR 4-1]AKU21897.1 sulfate transporter [Massilia sp. NR 4-1]
MNTVENTIQTTPGYRKNALGHLIPESKIKPIDLARDALVQELVAKAKTNSELLASFKSQTFADVHAFVQLSAEQYDAQIGGKKGNLTLFSFDGRYKVNVAKADNISFDERLQAAKALIDECIADWSRDSAPEIKVLVQQAFDTDREGNISTGRVLGLRRLEITDERWQRAMKAIGESVQVVGSKQYVRFYERVGDTDQYAPISLDVAKV